MAVDPVRAEKIRFTEPYVVIEGTYMVAADSGFATIDDVDRDGVRVAVGKGAAYDLYLTRTLKHARIERASTSAAAIDLFIEKSMDAVAGVRQPLEAYAAAHPGWHVLDGRFTAIEQAMAVPRGRPAAWEYLCSFIRDTKADGFIRQALARSGQKDAVIAP
jgi:polar amino acid transport system substrate-binding protein